MTKINRNDLCPCGSGKKYKKCCELQERERKKKQNQGSRSVRPYISQNKSSMANLANRAFHVLSSSMAPAKNALMSRIITNNDKDDHCHDHGCGCHHSDDEHITAHDQAIVSEEEKKAQERGFRTLEELIGVDNQSQANMCE